MAEVSNKPMEKERDPRNKSINREDLETRTQRPTNEKSVTAFPVQPLLKKDLNLLTKTSEPIRTGAFLQLQHSHGNAYVQRLVKSLGVQTKMTVSKPDDIHEQEADRVAETITGSPVVQREPEEEEELLQGKLQRQELPEEEEESELATKLQRAAAPEEEEPIQAKLQRQPEEEDLLQSKLQRQGTPEEEEVQTKLQLQELPEEEEEPLQAKATTNVPDVTADMEKRINSQKGSGQALGDSARTSLEPGFGRDFSQVRIHTGAEANSLSRELSAEAFTTGNDIFFREGAYQPESDQGKKLLAHELTHVVQQDGGVAPKISRQPPRYGPKEIGAPKEPPIQKPMSEEAWNDDYKKAEVHENSYFRNFENTLSAAETGYNEAVRQFETNSKAKTSSWKSFLVEAFQTALGLIPGYNAIKEGFVQIITGAGKYAKLIQELLGFAVSTVSKYGGTVLDSLQEKPSGTPAKSMPEVFIEARRVKEKEMDWVTKLKTAWVDTHRLVRDGKSKWKTWEEHDRLEPQFINKLQPVTKMGSTDFILEYEKQLWIEYLRVNVQKYIDVYPGGATFYFNSFDQDRMDYLRKRFTWGFYDVWDRVTRQRSTVRAFERMLGDWHEVH
jgi:hypothetical protein